MSMVERRAYELTVTLAQASSPGDGRKDGQRVAFSQDTRVAIDRFDVNGNNPVFQKSG